MQPFLFLVTAFLAVVAQCTLANLLSWGGARCELMPALVAYAALTTRWPLALWLALAGGIFQDALSANRLGVSAVALMAVAAAGFAVRRMVFHNQWVVQFAVGGVASLIASLVLWTLLTMGGLGWAFSGAGLLRIVQVAAMSVLVAPFMFRALDWVRARVGELPAPWEVSR